MKKIAVAVLGLALFSTAAYAAEGMDCCKKCECCKKDQQDKPAPQPK